jgi:hypothetical protein
VGCEWCSTKEAADAALLMCWSGSGLLTASSIFSMCLHTSWHPDICKCLQMRVRVCCVCAVRVALAACDRTRRQLSGRAGFVHRRDISLFVCCRLCIGTLNSLGLWLGSAARGQLVGCACDANYDANASTSHGTSLNGLHATAAVHQTR